MADRNKEVASISELTGQLSAVIENFCSSNGALDCQISIARGKGQLKVTAVIELPGQEKAASVTSAQLTVTPPANKPIG